MGLESWTPEQIEQGRRWVQAWREAGQVIERLRREELRRLDAYRAIALLCGPADYHVPHAHRSPLPAWWNNSTGSKRLPALNEVIRDRGTSGRANQQFLTHFPPFSPSSLEPNSGRSSRSSFRSRNNQTG
jgi:hypothetical protein